MHTHSMADLARAQWHTNNHVIYNQLSWRYDIHNVNSYANSNTCNDDDDTTDAYTCNNVTTNSCNMHHE